MRKNIFFDLYGTLLHNRTDEHSKHAYEKISAWLKERGIDIDPDKLKDEYFDKCKDHAKRMKKEYSEIRLDYVFFEILEEFKPSDEIIKELALEFRKATTTEIYPIPGSQEVLKELEKDNFNLAIVSNAQRIFTDLELQQFKFHKYFDHIFISSDIGVKKPSKKFFEYALKKMKVKPEDSIFVGNDIENDVETPKKMGFKTVFLTREGDFEGELDSPPDFKIDDIKQLLDIVRES